MLEVGCHRASIAKFHKSGLKSDFQEIRVTIFSCFYFWNNRNNSLGLHVACSCRVVRSGRFFLLESRLKNIELITALCLEAIA